MARQPGLCRQPVPEDRRHASSEEPCGIQVDAIVRIIPDCRVVFALEGLVQAAVGRIGDDQSGRELDIMCRPPFGEALEVVETGRKRVVGIIHKPAATRQQLGFARGGPALDRVATTAAELAVSLDLKTAGRTIECLVHQLPPINDELKRRPLTRTAPTAFSPTQRPESRSVQRPEKIA